MTRWTKQKPFASPSFDVIFFFRLIRHIHPFGIFSQYIIPINGKEKSKMLTNKWNSTKKSTVFRSKMKDKKRTKRVWMKTVWWSFPTKIRKVDRNEMVRPPKHPFEKRTGGILLRNRETERGIAKMEENDSNDFDCFQGFCLVSRCFFCSSPKK